MEYKVVHAQSVFSIKRALAALAQTVNEAISQGWEPQGGVIVTDHGAVAQAMVKRR